MQYRKILFVPFVLVLSMLTFGIASAQDVAQPASCNRQVTRHETFQPYFTDNTDRAILSDVLFTLPEGAQECLATYQIIYPALTDAYSTGKELKCNVQDQLRYMYGTCDSILTSEARVQFLVSKAFHGSELIGIASDTEDNWQFLVSSVEASSVNDCQLNVRSFASFTSLDGNNPNTSRIGEITVLGSIRPCNYNFFFRYTGTIDFFYADGAVRCSAIDQGTAH
jgi:hypothetical protein